MNDYFSSPKYLKSIEEARRDYKEGRIYTQEKKGLGLEKFERVKGSYR